jgi:hypothetical protein
MNRRKLILTGTAILVFGVAFAAQRTALHSDRSTDRRSAVVRWTPGSAVPMSAFENDRVVAERPR